jgi:hypothetical protein
MNACKKTPKKFELLNNVSLHVLILFIILSSLFLFYISKIEADALNKEVISYINNFDVATLGISKTFISDNIVNFVKSPPVPDYENNFINGIGTLTLPTISDTLIGRNTVDTLTNKTLTNPNINNPIITNFKISF